MRSKTPSSILLSTVVVIVVACVFIVALAIFLLNSNSNASTSVITTQAVATNNSATARATIAVTQTPAIDPDVTIISPTVAIGQKIPLPLDGQGTGIKLVRTDAAPIINLVQARTAVYNRSMNWALGGTHDGKTVKLTAAYGLATIGYPTADGKGWVGSQNIPLQTCTVKGICTPTGTTLNHIEGRPTWILDYSNTDFPASGLACVTTPCPAPQIYNYSVYAVDALTNSVITADFYTNP